MCDRVEPINGWAFFYFGGNCCLQVIFGAPNKCKYDLLLHNTRVFLQWLEFFSTKKSIPIFKVSQGLIFGAYQFRNCSPQNNMSISLKKKTIDLKARPPTSSTMFWWGSWSWAWICKTILGWWSCGRPKNSGNPWFLGEVTTLLIWKMRKKTSSKHRKEPSPSNLFAFLWFVGCFRK